MASGEWGLTPVKDPIKKKACNHKPFSYLDEKLVKLLRDSINQKDIRFAVSSRVCLGMSDVCIDLIKLQEKRMKEIEAKLKACKLGEIVLWKKTVNKLRKELTQSKKNHERFKKKFKQKAEAFKGLAKLFKEEIKDGRK